MRRAAYQKRAGWTIVLIALGLAVGVQSVLSSQGPIGLFENHEDVGSPKIAGAALYNGVSQECTASRPAA